MPAHSAVTDPIQPSGSIVDRATAILEGERSKSPPERLPSAGELPERVIGELEKRLGHLREQAQDLVDQLVRVAERLPAAPLERASTPSLEGISALPLVNATSIPELRTARAPVGGIAKTVLGLVNETQSPASVVLRATSLVNERGDELPGSIVTFAPNPLNLPVGAELPVQASALVPTGTRPGKYYGLVQAVGLEAARAVMTLDVIDPGSGG
jgi:hypothetical protein